MIRWSPRGRLRLRQCAKYILQESQDWLTTVKWRNEIDEAVTTLEDFPESGSIVREFSRKDIRQLLVGNYRIIYRVRKRQVEIISIRHTAFLVKSMRSL